MNSIDIERERSYPTPYANSSLLQLLLLSLIGQKHIPKTKKCIRKKYDYVVVGAGAAGSVVAARLAEEPCVSVLLLEAGPSPPLLTEVPAINNAFIGSDLDWNFTTVPQRHSSKAFIDGRMNWPRGKMLGGTASFNGMQFVRGNRKDFDGWEKGGCKDWGYDDVLPYFIKLENYTDPQFRDNGYHGKEGPITVSRPDYRSEIEEPLLEAFCQLGYQRIDVNGPTQTGVSTTHANMRRGQRCSPMKAYLVPSDQKPNFDIIKEAYVTKLIIKNKSAIGVEFDWKNRRRKVWVKREVILSAGTTSTPKILMLSGIGPKKHLQELGIAVVADLPVGKNLHDHPGIDIPFELDVKSFHEEISSEDNILEYISKKSGPLSQPFGGLLPAIINSKYSRDKDYPDLMYYFIQGSAKSVKNLGITPFIYQRFYRPYENKTVCVCGPSMMHPLSRGTVTLKSSDPYESPVIDPNYLEDPFDLDVMTDSVKICYQIINSEPMKKLGSKLFSNLFPGCEHFVQNDDFYYRCIATALTITTQHHVGTCKMGDPNDHTTVVDSRLRIKGISGLRVVDASVMPEITAGNTLAPILMIAEKASDIIKEDIENHCFD